jgi:hypothetical protein
MKLQVVRAIYKGGALTFAQPELAPRDGAEVIVTYLAEGESEALRQEDPLQALRGRGKGERLVEKLLRSRREDRERDEAGRGEIRP